MAMTGRAVSRSGRIACTCAAATAGIASYPWSRTISSTKSSSMARSKRYDGGVTEKSSPARTNEHSRRREVRRDRLGGDLDAQETRNARGTNAHWTALGQRTLDVGKRSSATSAAIENELSRALDGARAATEVDAALEAIAGVAREAQAPRLALDDGGIPVRAFEQQHRRRVADAGILAAHDARQAQRLFLVGDEQQVRLEIERLLVQQEQLLAGSREPHEDRTLQSLRRRRRAVAVPTRASRSW